MKEHGILIIGGGLAGLTAAIHLALEGLDVAVIEIQQYPHHKVCGEYVSKEIEPYLKGLGVDLKISGALAISKFQISTQDGFMVQTELPLGGFGISRYAFDNLLFKRAQELGVHFYFEKVVETVFKKDSFTIKTKTGCYFSKIAIGAYGKRSVLDKNLNRDFSKNKQSWLAVKAHYYNNDFPENLVALHNFKGGYGGLSKTETGAVNFCYLVHYDSFKTYKDVNSFNKAVVAENPFLKKFLSTSEPIFERPMTIAQIAFDKKETIVDHMLMCGDTAGLIHPLCGNGMAMAIHSAQIASELIVRFFNDADYSRNLLEQDYKLAWAKAFKNRLWFGRKLQGILMNKALVSLGIKSIGRSSSILKYIISKTHGDLIT